MAHSLISYLALLALVSTATFAFVKGGAEERGVAFVICLSWAGGFVASVLVGHLLSRQVEELTLLGIDAVLAVGLLFLALRFAKIWLGFAMLMQSCELALHGAAMGDWGFSFRQYVFFNNAVSFGLLLLLAGATVTAWIQRTHKVSKFSAENSTTSILA